MFGGHSLYCDGFIFGLVANNALYLKADDVNRSEFEARSSRPFKPFEDKPEVMSYYEAPPEIFEDPDAMRHWVGGAVEAGRRGKAPKPRRKAAKRARSA
jgi:DNA transformation protein